MKRIFFVICILLSLSLVGCSEQQQSRTSRMSEKDKAALRGATAIDMIKKGRREEGMKLLNKAQDDWNRAHNKE